MKRFTLFCGLLTVCTLMVAPIRLFAQSQPAVVEDRGSQVAAATAQAVQSLKSQITALPIARNLTVQELLDRTGGEDEFVSALERSEQIGAPRWIDEHTCQVKLEISGDRVANT